MKMEGSYWECQKTYLTLLRMMHTTPTSSYKRYLLEHTPKCDRYLNMSESRDMWANVSRTKDAIITPSLCYECDKFDLTKTLDTFHTLRYKLGV